MDLQFVPAKDNIRTELLGISLFEEQKGFIEPVTECLREADQNDRWHPYAIFHENRLIGFTMYGSFNETPDGERVWLDRLMIDRQEQGKGYGKSAVIALTKRLFSEYPADRIYLSVYDDNPHAIHLYESCGFRFNGENDTKGEKIMTLMRP